jgi:DNA-binding NarL/FixJ family response regulator
LLPYEGCNLVVGPAVVSLGAASRYLGLVAITMSCWDDAERHFEGALKRNAPSPPWLAHTQYDYARMLLARSGPSRSQKAVDLLEEALGTAQGLGMRTLEERIRARIEQARSVSGRPNVSYPGGLSEREVEVLQLVARGKSNREIAAELFISMNTVANHIRNILGKTGAANRAEAAAYAVRHGLSSN